MEFLQANWFWILLGLGVVWLAFRRGGMGCGMGGHNSHGSGAATRTRKSAGVHGAHDGSGAGDSREPEAAETASPRRHGGC